MLEIVASAAIDLILFLPMNHEVHQYCMNRKESIEISVTCFTDDKFMLNYSVLNYSLIIPSFYDVLFV